MLAGIFSAASVQAAHRAPATKPEKPKEEIQSVTGNPLLPPQIALDGFFPAMTAVQAQPTIAPAGFFALYSPADWRSYRDKYGTEADDLTKKKSSGQIEFARKLIADSHADRDRPGLQRLLLVRAAAIAFRSREGTPVAAEAIGDFQQVMDLSVPADVGALWTMADALTKYATTPKPDRQKFSNLAAKADIQFVGLLLDLGQIQGAQQLAKALNRHDVAIRNDARLKPMANQCKAVVSQTVEMMDNLAQQWTAFNNGDPSAAMPLYLYARFARPEPGLVRALLNRKGQNAVASLDAILAQAEKDPMVLFTAGEALKNAAANLPEGVLKHRTLYAAWRYYSAFLESPATEHERVNRTLAGIAKQAVISDGAHAAPVLKPFEIPTTAPTQPAQH